MVMRDQSTPSLARLQRREACNQFVYIVQAHLEKPLYKIGKTNRPKIRLALLRSISPAVLQLVHVIRTNQARRLEAYLHGRYCPQRQHGEWFALDDRHLAEIRAVRQCWYPAKLPRP